MIKMIALITIRWVFYLFGDEIFVGVLELEGLGPAAFFLKFTFNFFSVNDFDLV